MPHTARFFSSLLIFGLLIMALMVALASHARASDMPNILVLGMDAKGVHKVKRQHVANDQPRKMAIRSRRGGALDLAVRDAIAGALHEAGFNVYDEAAVTMGQVAQHIDARSDAEVIGIAKAATNPPIDVAVIYSAYGTVKDNRYARKIRLRLTGRILHVRTGQRLGNFEVKTTEPIHVSPDCRRGCVTERAVDEAATLGPDLGDALATKLQHIMEPQLAAYDDRHQVSDVAALPMAYNLVFRGFKPKEVNVIEEYLVAFSGYRHHRPVKSSRRFVEYWYESDISSARLNRNLRKMMARTHLPGRVAFSGNTFHVERIRTDGPTVTLGRPLPSIEQDDSYPFVNE